MEDRIARSLCGMCVQNCGITIRITGGRIARIEGDPDHPVNRGFLCPKAQAIKPLLESEERLKFPLKKTKGGFVRVSWDEALDLAADRLMKLRNAYGPEGLFLCNGSPSSYGARDGFMQFMGAFGSPNLTGIGNMCFVPRMVACLQAFGGRPEPDLDKTNLAVFWGLNPLNTFRFSGYAAYDGIDQIIPRLKKRGAKIILIDPVRSESVSVADEWIRPNVATDGALGLAMAHTMITEGLYDRDFVKKWVLGFDEIKKHLKLLTPEWAEKITAVPAERIRGLARLYATTDGAAILDGTGLDMHTNGVDMVRVLTLLIALTANIDRPGGNVFFSIVPQTALPTVKPLKKRMALEQFSLFPQIPFPAVKEALINESQDRPRAMIVHHGNPVLVQAHQQRTIKALNRLDFMMALDVFPTATTQIADLVLPAAADFETVDYRAYSSGRGGFVALRDKLFEPAGEARSVFSIEYELARRMGIEGSYPFRNDEEWLEFVLKPASVTLRDLRRNQIVYASPALVYRKYMQDGFKTPSGKVECFSERCEKAGHGALPHFQYSKEFSTMPAYPLLGTSRRPAEFVHTKLINIFEMRKRYPEPLVRLHPWDAEPRGIGQDEIVLVESPRGAIRLKANITADVVPGLISIDFGWGNPSDGQSSINVLTTDAVWDPISGGYPNRNFICEVKKVPG